MPKPPASSDGSAARRVPLSRDRVLRAALALADEGGVEAVSMRRLGQALNVEAMSLYKHVADKEAILDGIADLVMDEVEVPSGDLDWRTAVRRSAISAHEALRRHPWAGTVLESRLNPGPARLRYLDAVVGVLRGAGFDTATVARAFMALDSHTYGFTMQELALPFDADGAAGVAEEMAARVFANAYPNLVAMAELAMSGAQMLDFEFGLDLLLDGLERLRPATRGRSGA
jgi:AcrR family transcriptional regulator